jgi:hypothetical protein
MIAGGEISIFPSVQMRIEPRRIFRPGAADFHRN